MLSTITTNDKDFLYLVSNVNEYCPRTYQFKQNETSGGI